MTTPTQILQQVFGFSAFRQPQDKIIQTLIAGNDALVLMPTGGGKSLCYQIPALARDGCGIVISPLIALMQDQVDAMRLLGVKAAFLNSTQSADEVGAIEQQLIEGVLDLLYIAPERLTQARTLHLLKEAKLALFAIDEAHCVSQWGHDFRADYLQLNLLHEIFPAVPRIALTATADARTREEIVSRLQLDDAEKFIAGFDRPNIRYRIGVKHNARQQLLKFLKSEHQGDSGIVYCLSRNKTEDIAAWLSEQGFNAYSYHAGLSAELRSAHQALFLRNEAVIIVATIAFGMGIDKPDVRFVIHQDLPKNLEGYYQETGRAGRDGLSADCVLLFNAADVTKQTGFIEEKDDEHERAVARQLLQKMVQYAESRQCRQRVLLDYFSEKFEEENCRACDNCLEPKETFDGTEAAQKLLACIYRVRAHGRFSVGLNHIVDILCGADTEKIRRWGHEKLSTYNIGNEFGRDEWKVIARELVRLELAHQTPGQMSVIELTDAGLEWLRNRDRPSLELTRPAPTKSEKGPRPRKARAGELACDQTLFDQLRTLRRELASERGVPPYIIFGDVALRHMAREYPSTLAEFGHIHGVGEKKLNEYGELFTQAITTYLETNPKQGFES